jgi:hypothetical protein
MLGGISEEERERRVRECETCADDLRECMRKIPYAD